jgi:ABC-type sulfate transport system permease component
MVFVGTGPRVQVMPTMMWLELSVGNIEVSLAIALIMLVMAGAGLAVVHIMVRGRNLL